VRREARVTAGQDHVRAVAGLLLYLRDSAAALFSGPGVHDVPAAVADQSSASLVHHLPGILGTILGRLRGRAVPPRERDTRPDYTENPCRTARPRM
jgi:hypothetical protein